MAEKIKKSVDDIELEKENRSKFELLRYLKMLFKTSPVLILFIGINALNGLIWSLAPVGLVSFLLQAYEKGKPFLTIIWIAAGFALLYWVQMLVAHAMNAFLGRAYRTLQRRLNYRFYQKLESIDYETQQTTKFANNYIKLVENGVNNAWGTFWNCSGLVSSIVSVIALSAVLSSINIWSFVYAFVIGVIYFFISRKISYLYRMTDEHSKQLFRHRQYFRRVYYLKDAAVDLRTTEMSSMIIDQNNEVGVKIVKNFDHYRSKIFWRRTVENFLINSVYAVSVGLICYSTIADIRNLNFSLFSALLIAAGTLSSFIAELSSSVASFQEAAVNSHDYFRIMDMTCNLEKSGSVEVEGFRSLELKDVSYTYPGNDAPSLSNINLKISKGEKIAIVGENGAGKTTLVKMLLRLYDPTSGKVNCNGINYKEIFPKSIREMIGAVFQDYQIYALSIAENILLRKLETEEDISLVYEAIKFAGLDELVSGLTEGIRTQLTKEFDKNGLELSGGERQKFAIARIYASDSELMLLDEPSSALDPIAEANVYDKLLSISELKTIIFVSHRLSTTSKADRIYLFEKGRITETGTHNELMAIENGRYRFMFQTQAKEYLERGGHDESIS